MRRSVWQAGVARGTLLLAFLAGPVVLTPGPAVALDLDPFEYYEVDYHIAFSDAEVEPGEEFSITVGAHILCTKDMPFGADEATVVFSASARHADNGTEEMLLDEYEVIVTDVPDWQGDTFDLEESVDLAFPDGVDPGQYEVVAEVEHASLDGWNITALIPGGYRSVPVGPITVTSPEVEPPAPPTNPGHLNITVLGHEYSPGMDDGVLTEDVSAVLIEGEVTLLLSDGTRCLDSSEDPLGYISLVHKSSPASYADGLVVAAYSLYPNGATFSPPLSLAIRYDGSELPDGVDADDLTLAYYKGGAWSPVVSSLEDDVEAVRASIPHFSTIGLLAPTRAPSPTEFAIEDLRVSPATVPPASSVYVTFSVRNTGGTAGTYPLMVEVNGSSEYAREISLGPSESRNVRLWIARSTPGTYTVSVGDVNSSFAVAPASGEVDTAGAPGETGETGSTSPSLQNVADEQEGLHPALIVLLAMAGIAFVTLVILLLAGVL